MMQISQTLQTIGRGAVVLGAVLWMGTQPAQAQEWTRFRGPNGTGHAAAIQLPDTITAADFAWKTDLPGIGHSEPVLWGNKVFLTSAEADTGVRHVLCVDAADGRLLWDQKTTFQKYTTHRLNNFAAGTPTCDAERVYVAFSVPEMLTVYAFTHAGKLVWKQDLGKQQTQHGGAGSLVLVGSVLIVPNDQDGDGSFLAGLDPKTGAVKWRRPRNTSDAASYATPMVYTPPGGKPEVLFASTAHGLTSLNPDTGAVNWEAGGLFKQRTVFSPILAEGLIIVGSGNGAGDRLTVAVQPGKSNPATPPTVKYSLGRGASYVPTPVYDKGLLYMWGDGGIVTCYRAATGEQVWSDRVGGNFYGSPILIGGRLYALSARGELVVIEAGEKFKLVTTCDLGQPSHSTPTVAAGRLFLRTEGRLICIQGKS